MWEDNTTVRVPASRTIFPAWLHSRRVSGLITLSSFVFAPVFLIALALTHSWRGVGLGRFGLAVCAFFQLCLCHHIARNLLHRARVSGALGETPQEFTLLTEGSPGCGKTSLGRAAVADHAGRRGGE